MTSMYELCLLAQEVLGVDASRQECIEFITAAVKDKVALYSQEPETVLKDKD